MKADNIDHFEVVLPYRGAGNRLDLLDWVKENYVDCHRVSFDIWLVTGRDDATLMKLWWG
jgi:hypothetical protein